MVGTNGRHTSRYPWTAQVYFATWRFGLLVNPAHPVVHCIRTFISSSVRLAPLSETTLLFFQVGQSSQRELTAGTPFLVYFTRHINLQPATAFLFTQFQSANLVSALLVSSNPTNLVLTSAFHISFLSYSAWLALPVLAGVVCLYPLLILGVFRKQGLIPDKLDPPKVDPWSAFVDPVGGIFGAVLFAVTIVALVALSAVGLLEGAEGVWTVTAPAACVMLARDIIHDVAKYRTELQSAASPELPSRDVFQPSATGPTKLRQRTDSGLTNGDIAMQPIRSETSSQQPVVPSGSLPAASLPPPTKSPNALQRLLPTPYLVISRLPWALLPFAFSMFILVEGLQETGWINIFGRWWGAWVDVSGVAGSVAMMGLIGVLGCNVSPVVHFTYPLT